MSYGGDRRGIEMGSRRNDEALKVEIRLDIHILPIKTNYRVPGESLKFPVK